MKHAIFRETENDYDVVQHIYIYRTLMETRDQELSIDMQYVYVW